MSEADRSSGIRSPQSGCMFHGSAAMRDVMRVTTIQRNRAADCCRCVASWPSGCRGGYEIMIEELGIPDLDLIKQAQQGAARCLPAPTVRSSRTMWYPWPEAAVLILTNQEGETL